MSEEKKENTAISPEKLKALQMAMEKIEKSHGKGSIMRMGDDNIEDVEVIHSGSIALDYALGVGGYPRGRLKNSAVSPLLSMPSTLSTASMPRNSVLT